MKKILIQGAMDIETDYLMEQVQNLSDYECYEKDGFVFHIGSTDEKMFIISKTGMGTVKAAMATTYALKAFHPTCVINQGTAGAQEKGMGTGDVVLVEEAVNVNILNMPKKKLGEGCAPFLWENPDKTYYRSDKILLSVFASHECNSGRMMKGKTATGDIYSREDDRILWLAKEYGTCCEEMESAAVFEVCERFKTPCVGVRIISNNELKDEEFNRDTAGVLQKYIWKVVSEQF